MTELETQLLDACKRALNLLENSTTRANKLAETPAARDLREAIRAADPEWQSADEEVETQRAAMLALLAEKEVRA